MASFIKTLLERSADERKRFFQPDYDTPERYAQSLSRYRDAFKEMIGMPDEARFFSTETAVNGIRIEHVGDDTACAVYRVWIPLGESLTVYSLLLLPHDRGEKTPLIVACHGGGGCPEAICGLDIREPYHSIGYRLAERGYAVWAPFVLMTVGYGGDETRVRDRYLLDQNAMLAGTRVVGLEVYKINRGLEVLLAARPEIDGARVGMTGLSYGGFFTLFCGAASTRFSACAPSAYFHEYTVDQLFAKEAVVSGMDRRYPNGLNKFDLASVAALICPRPLLIQNGEVDTVIPVEGARRAAPKVQAIYDRLGISDRFEFQVHPGAHEFDNERIYSFFAGALGTG